MIKQFVFGNRTGIVQRSRKSVSKRLSKATLLFIVALPHMVFAATYHVAPSGSDSNPGTSSQPWRTMGKANSTLQPGDTVLIHAGTYGKIRPARSGVSDSNRITYKVFGDGDVFLTDFSGGGGPTQGAVALGARNYVTVSGRADGDPVTMQRLKLIPKADVGSLGNLCGSEGSIVENIYGYCENDSRNCSRGFGFCVSWWPGDYETKYNILRNSHIIGNSSTSSDPANYTEDLITVSKNAHHNLIENNTFERAKHVVVRMAEPNAYAMVLRNNTVTNLQHTALTTFKAGSNLANGSRFLIENNIFTATAGTPAPEGSVGHAFQAGASEMIVRYNVMQKAGGDKPINENVLGWAGTMNTGFGTTDDRLYNNTIVKNKGVGIGMLDTGGGTGLGRNAYVNNFVYDSMNPSAPERLVLYWDKSVDTDDRWIRNVFGRPNGDAGDNILSSKGAAYTLATAISSLRGPYAPEFTSWNGFNNVYDKSPGFTNYGSDDYGLTSSSPYLDTGAPLTQVSTSDSGSGKTLYLKDSRFFNGEASDFPVWMGVENDWICVGPSANNIRVEGTDCIQIASVNDSNNIVTLTSSIMRSVDEYVWLYKDSDGTKVISGAAPDIGAYEYMSSGGEVFPPSPPTNLKVIN